MPVPENENVAYEPTASLHAALALGSDVNHRSHENRDHLTSLANCVLFVCGQSIRSLSYPLCCRMPRHSAHELLDHLCAGKYDAVIYNPAGFGAEVVSSDAYCMNPSSSSDPAHSRVDTRQPSLNEPVWGRGRALDGRRALEYGLIRAGCPIVSLSPRDVHLEGVLDGSSSGRPLNQAAGYIAGFSGAVSYRLAIAAVADMFESQGE